jgi:hypothetical protein
MILCVLRLLNRPQVMDIGVLLGRLFGLVWVSATEKVTRETVLEHSGTQQQTELFAKNTKTSASQFFCDFVICDFVIITFFVIATCIPLVIIL